MMSFPIIEKLGGRAAALAVLQQRGMDYETIHAIRMWVARGSIPGDAQRALMAEADDRNIAYLSQDFVAQECNAIEAKRATA